MTERRQGRAKIGLSSQKVICKEGEGGSSRTKTTLFSVWQSYSRRLLTITWIEIDKYAGIISHNIVFELTTVEVWALIYDIRPIVENGIPLGNLSFMCE